MEHREAARYRLATRVAFTWQETEGNRLKGAGITRDISVGGAFIFSAACPAVDSAVRLNIFLPPSHKGATSIIRIATEGRVLRVEFPLEGEGASGFAVASKGYMLYKQARTDT